jgi:putative SOS response-associated peptidase YedK
MKIGYSTINAEAETVATKAVFRDAFKWRRCLIVTDGFYEWTPVEEGEQPYRIVMKDREPFALGGLWERWKPKKGEPIETFTIITTEPNAVCSPIHDRMPVVIAPEDFDAWLSAAPGSEALMRPYPPDQMEAYPVSKAVGSPKNDGAELVESISM